MFFVSLDGRVHWTYRTRYMYVCTTSVVLLPRIRDPWHDQIDHPRVRMDLQCGTRVHM